MSCGIPQFFSLLWSIRDTVRTSNDSSADWPQTATSGLHSESQLHSHAETPFQSYSQGLDSQDSLKTESRTYSPPDPLTASEFRPSSPTEAQPGDSKVEDRSANRPITRSLIPGTGVLGMGSSGDSNCYATLLTRPSYLPGVIVLAYTLQKQRSQYPLVVLVTPSLPQECVDILDHIGSNMKFEDGKERLKMWKVDPLLPDKWQLPESLIAARFEDTWTKLRVFELINYDAVCFLDADIAIFGDIDSIFPITAEVLPDITYLAATHACVCNLDRDSWADADWHAANCAYTPQSHPSALTAGPPVPSIASNDPRWATRTLLNGGVFVFHPSQDLWNSMLDLFKTTDKLKEMKFPDQDFLALFFRDRWRTVPWRFNALKTMRYWHENIWGKDEDVVALHYIVDKPWARRIASDRIAGHLGRDGETHRWWWDLWDEWKGGWERVVEGDSAGRARYEFVMEKMNKTGKLVAEPLSEEDDRRQVAENKGNGLPIPVPEH